MDKDNQRTLKGRGVECGLNLTPEVFRMELKREGKRCDDTAEF